MTWPKIRDQILALWKKLSRGQRLTLGLVAVAVGGGLAYLVHWEKERNFRPLFTKLSPEDAGQLTARLRERQIDYRLAENGATILVPRDRIAELRLELAAEGLPKSGRIGYELFDKTSLTTTDFQEQVNFRRALEGELERSIATIEEVEAARVHVTPAKESVFAESRRPAKASVTVRLKPEQVLSPGNIQAITHLVASAVDGLMPENVSVIDTRGQLLTRVKKPEGGDPAAELDHEQLLYRQKLENDLIAKVHATLDPLLGPAHYRAAVAAEVDFSSGEQSEEVFDPTKSVMSSQQRTEDWSTNSAPAGTPGTPSNLPRPAPRPGDTGKLVQRRTENITYQSTRTVKRVRLPKGNLRRLSVSVLVDHHLRWEGTGPQAKRILEPPPPEVLKKIADVVAAATGLQPQRGDSIIVESIPFEATLAQKPPPGPGTAPGARPLPFPLPDWVPESWRDPRNLGAWLLAALVVAGLLIWILYRIVAGLVRLAVSAGRAIQAMLGKKKGKGKAPESAPELGSAAAAALPGAPSADGSPAALPGQSVEANAQVARSFTGALAEQAQRKAAEEASALEALQVSEAVPRKAEVLVRHLAAEAEKDPEQIAHLLRNWLQADSLTK